MSVSAVLRKLLPSRALDSLRDVLWRALDIKWTLRCGLPVELHGLSDWVVYSDIFVDGEYDEAIDHAYANLREGEKARILDVGSNVGFFTLRCLDIAARRGVGWDRLDLVLVEGSPQVFRDLTARVAHWGRAASAVRARHGLAGLLEGAGAMGQAGLNCMGRVATEGEPAPKGSLVPYLDLRADFSEGGGLHLLKCDIEGSELAFLETYRNQLGSVRAVVIELHHDRCDTARCMQVLDEAGFVHRRMLREMPAFSVAFFWK